MARIMDAGRVTRAVAGAIVHVRGRLISKEAAYALLDAPYGAADRLLDASGEVVSHALQRRDRLAGGSSQRARTGGARGAP